MKTAEFMKKFIENWRLFRENPKIYRLPKTVITQDIEQMLLLIHNMLTTCANCWNSFRGSEKMLDKIEPI